MSRNHIHFAPGLPNDSGVVSGMRQSCEIYIYINVERAMGDGIKFYRSKNNVILSDGFGGLIPLTYFEKVVDVETGRQLVSSIEAKTSIITEGGAGGDDHEDSLTKGRGSSSFRGGTKRRSQEAKTEA